MIAASQINHTLLIKAVAADDWALHKLFTHNQPTPQGKIDPSDARLADVDSRWSALRERSGPADDTLLPKHLLPPLVETNDCSLSKST